MFVEESFFSHLDGITKVYSAKCCDISEPQKFFLQNIHNHSSCIIWRFVKAFSSISTFENIFNFGTAKVLNKKLLYGEKVSRGESFARKKKREILGIYFREWPNEFFLREENFRKLRVFRIRFC